MLRILFITVFSLIFAFQSLSGAESADSTDEKFNPGSVIFDHIADSYDWHLFTITGKSISIPLPVILYSREKGLDIFMSSRFDHGHSSYKGYMIGSEEPSNGKIVHADSDTGLIINLSMTKNVTGMLFASLMMLAIFLSIGKRYKNQPLSAPHGLQGLFEPLIVFVIDDIVKPGIGEGKYEKFLPYLLTLFFFIWINNMLGLIPIFPMGANVTGNISVTAGLAVTAFFAINLSGNRKYWQHIFNTPNVPVFLKLPIPLMPFIELIGLFTKPFVLMVRLFANITAGHIITLGFVSLIFVFSRVSPAFGYGAMFLSVAFGIFITLLELLVALIQAYVFTLLTSLFIGAAVEDGH